MKNEKRLTRVCAYARERAQVMKWGGGWERRRKNGEGSAKNGLFWVGGRGLSRWTSEAKTTRFADCICQTAMRFADRSERETAMWGMAAKKKSWNNVEHFFFLIFAPRTDPN